MENACAGETVSCLEGCGFDGRCQSECLSGDSACRLCVANNYRNCALRRDACHDVTREWICCLEAIDCYGRAFDEDCQAACSPDGYLSCLESLGSECDSDVNSCF